MVMMMPAAITTIEVGVQGAGRGVRQPAANRAS